MCICCEMLRARVLGHWNVLSVLWCSLARAAHRAQAARLEESCTRARTHAYTQRALPVVSVCSERGSNAIGHKVVLICQPWANG